MRKLQFRECLKHRAHFPFAFSPISTSRRIASERPISFLEMERMTHLAEQGQRSVSVEAEVAILVGRDQCDFATRAADPSLIMGTCLRASR